ncbi:glycosyltransferase family 2 protein [Pectinatus frisingensis]|uniref:glycosyltransferase family 2 protein n=1 Tax=Pectinatus frisingensis TaxID=865 RepID=UPI003D8061CF
MNNKLKISIITVSYNAVRTIEQTIQSVLNQTYDNIEYIIIDGGSTDGTVDIIKKYENKIAYWVSEPDGGMYEALVKGLKQITGDICAYINADDFYQTYSFKLVADIFNSKKVKWLTGMNTIYNDKSQITDVVLPYKYRNKFILKGLYNGKMLPFIQQESTFWRTDLNNQLDYSILAKLKYAGDYYLWISFANEAKLNIISAVLSGFRKTQGQLSENIDEYRNEVADLTTVTTNCFDFLLAVIDKICWKYAKRLNNEIINYDFKICKWK